MARRASRTRRGGARKAAAVQRRLVALHREAAALRRKERSIWREVEKLAARRTGRVTRVRHDAAGARRLSHGQGGGRRTSLAVARQRGGGGLFCDCPPIRIFPQPNDDLDICVLVGCGGGFCDYWCFTLAAPPVVGIARGARRRGARRP